MTTTHDRNTRRMAGGAARAARGREGAHAAQRRAGAAAAGSCRGCASTRSIDSTPTRGAPRWRTSSAGRSQLLVYHFMFGPDYTAGCPSCSSIADGFNGIAVHLANHDVTLVGGVARAAREAAGVQAAHGMDVPVGVVVRQRLQRRLQRRLHRGAAARGRHRIQLPARAPRSRRERARSDASARTAEGRSAVRGHDAAPTRRRTRASGRA